jgi:hypothetical protein
MAESEQKGGNFNWWIAIALIAAAGGVYIGTTALTSSRPIFRTGVPLTSLGPQDAEARLWQDPLDPTHLHQNRLLWDSRHVTDADNADLAAEKLEHDVSTLRTEVANRAQRLQGPKADSEKKDTGSVVDAGDGRNQPKDTNARVLIMPVVIRGGSYADVIEDRLRIRQAVLQALGVSGYVPENGDHVGYVTLPWTRNVLRPSTQPFKSGDQPLNRRMVEKPVGEILVPYEWCNAIYGQEKLGTQLAGERKIKSILVLWVTEEVLDDMPLSRLGYLLNRVGFPGKGTLKCTILGPRTSTVLRAMVVEAASTFLDPETWNNLDGVKFYSAGATAADDLLTYRPTNDPDFQPTLRTAKGLIEKAFAGHVTFTRTINTDDRIVAELIKELGRRGVDVSAAPPALWEQDNQDAWANVERDHVVILSEWDTFYGRALPLSFASMATGVSIDALFEHENVRPERWIKSYRYLRGIDGQLGDQTPQTAKSDAPAKDGNAPSAESTEGLNQSDYLRRLAQQLSDLDQKWFRETGSGIRAVGLLGSDVYDKLMILRAVRDRLPRSLFFTDNLDARFANPAEWRETHNLIIGSPFGLTLNPAFQRQIPPFRDAYQTAAYEGTLMALGTLPPEVSVNPPRVFEIGHEGPHDLSADDHSDSELAQARPPNVHPERPDRAGWWTGLRVFWVALGVPLALGLAFVGVALIQGLGWLRRLRAVKLIASPVPFLIWSIPLTVAIIWWLYAAQWRDGVPFAFFGGISIWPSEAIRLFLVLLCVHFLFKATADLFRSNVQIMREFRLNPAHIKGWKIPVSPWLIGDDWKVSVVKSPGGLMVNADRLWKVYLELGSNLHRLGRIALPCAIYWLFGFMLLKIFGMPVVPYRGGTSLVSDMIISRILAVGLVILLTFYVIDATWLNVRFIGNLTRGSTDWPDSTMKKFTRRYNLAPEDLDDVLDIRLIGCRTSAINGLIYYPFIALSLMLVSRAGNFADWNWPIGLVIVLGLDVLLAMGAAFWLRRAAEEARTRAIDRLRAKLVKYLASAGGYPKAQAIAQFIEEVKDCETGAFAPLSRQPVIRAMLLPFGSAGVWAVIDHFARG